MELCPKCKTGLYLKQCRETGKETIVVKTCRNPSCGSCGKDVEVVKTPREQPKTAEN